MAQRGDQRSEVHIKTAGQGQPQPAIQKCCQEAAHCVQSYVAPSHVTTGTLPVCPVHMHTGIAIENHMIDWFT